MVFTFDKVQKFVKNCFTKLLNKKLSKTYHDDQRQNGIAKCNAYLEFQLHQYIALYEYNLNLLADNDMSSDAMEAVKADFHY